MTKTCEYCCKPFEVDGSNKNEVRRLYCCDFCRSEAWREKAKERVRVGKRSYNVECEICGNVFLTNRSTNKTCSPECHHERELRVKRENTRKKREAIKNGTLHQPEPQKKVETLAERNEKARAMNMTYGEYDKYLRIQEMRKEREKRGRT